MTHFAIQGQTMNADVHTCLNTYAPTVMTGTKKHVAGCGYVYFMKDNAGKTIAQVSRVNGSYNNGEWASTHMRVTIL